MVAVGVCAGAASGAALAGPRAVPVVTSARLIMLGARAAGLAFVVRCAPAEGHANRVGTAAAAGPGLGASSAPASCKVSKPKSSASSSSAGNGGRSH